LTRILEQAGITCRLTVLKEKPTITKLRVISRHQQLIRLDFEDGFEQQQSTGLSKSMSNDLAAVGAVILSDYGKGTLGQINQLIQQCKAAGKPVLIDPKGSDFERYRGATLITPNMHEFEAVVGKCRNDAELEQKGDALIQQLDLDALLVTRSEQGMTLLQRAQEPLHLPAQAREVFDVTGAGDTVISVLAASLAAGMSLPHATSLANLAAGIVVSKLGTATVSVHELHEALHAEHILEGGIVDEDMLIAQVEAAKRRGEKVIMTNGCFDILHSGHVAYLQQARREGDRLVVAVNTDETVKALKGEDRPVNTLERRMHVLAALECVDWVVPFAEETPTRLICEVKPDVLVKGGDNDPEKIPGGDCVRQAGGEVKVLTYVENVSTTGIISSIRSRSDKA
jgi:D-beta-D-heptose 7-phosphate kinase/D-beta-D-heptose 1-phosphate adenosyltransferase